ncbi:hypothetical protein GCM10009760_64290 [Kitasatospora kazusensis]|uniref:Uncharacterized protein n=1 Tax=Kitasatospora kazusensis TaxID=407974 RepID=A0ABN1ZNB5_9ACTN
MTLAATRKPTCGAPRPGQSAGAPCNREPFHRDDHTNALAETWPRLAPVRCTRCGGPAPKPIPIGHQEATGGPGFTLWACSPTCPS